jgi:hypothetical protein
MHLPACEWLFYGGVFQYPGVPINIYQGLIAASSHGSYFDAYIKKAGYPYRKTG